MMHRAHDFHSLAIAALAVALLLTLQTDAFAQQRSATGDDRSTVPRIEETKSDRVQTEALVIQADAAKDMFCSTTASLAFRACEHQAEDDLFIAAAICLNISDDEQREECYADAEEARDEALTLCREQRSTRRDACKSLGEARYDPDIDPELFEDDFASLMNPNRYYPLTIGNRWEYRGGSEINTLEVLNETKQIEGVTCIVVNDQVFKDGQLVEDTDDWFAQARDGNVWYFGEEVKDFESFEGDDPVKPELVSIDGSFKWGRDGDKGGVIFRSSPKKGDVYIEEFSLGNAEDVTEVLSTAYAFGREPALDQLVPEQVAKILCSAGDCVVTRNFSLLEPGVFARKYYAPGIGVFLEVDPDAKEVVQLVNCNFDPRCKTLPAP
jgi:hypothetical protein